MVLFPDEDTMAGAPGTARCLEGWTRPAKGPPK